MANLPQLLYAIAPTAATVSTTQNFVLTVTNASSVFPVTMLKAGDQITISNWASLTQAVSQISPLPPPSTNWRIGLATSYIKIWVIADTQIPAGGSVQFQINNVAIDATVGQGNLTVMEVVGGQVSYPPDIVVGKLGSELQIFAYANPVTVGLGQTTVLNWTIIQGVYVKVVPPDDGKQYPRSGTGPYSFAIPSRPFQDSNQTTYTLTVYNSPADFRSALVVVNLSPPVITLFKSDPLGPISIDGSLTLSWSAAYATQASITPSTGGTAVPVAGTKTYTSSNLKSLVVSNNYQSPLTFTLVAQGYKQPAQLRLPIALQPVTITWFRFADFEHSAFTYQTANATSVSLPSISSQPPFTLTAQGPLGPVSQTLLGQGVQVLVLNADPPVIKVGDSSTLKFQVQSATSAKLLPGDIPLTFDPQTGIGNTSVSPTVTTTYSLVARDGSGNEAKSPITVTATPTTGRLTTKRSGPSRKRRQATRTNKGARR